MRIVFAGYRGGRISVVFKVLLLALVLFVVAVGTIGIASASVFGKAHPANSSSSVQQILVTNGSTQWSTDKHTTPLAAPQILIRPQMLSVSPLFASYYGQNGVAADLGKPLTSAFPVVQGWLQFFNAGALFLPTTLETYIPQDRKNELGKIISADTRHVTGGIVRLTLLQALLSVGSLAPVGGEGSTLTYASLRNATKSQYMVPEQMPASMAANTYTRASMTQSTFIRGGILGGKSVGHVISAPFWSYINSLDPKHWQQDIGVPLTEALPFTVTENGVLHHMLVQVFSYTGLVVDGDSSSSDSPAIYPLNIGMDYLRTFGLPDVRLKAKQSLWSQGDSILFDGPGTGHAIAHIGQNSPLVTLGNTQWLNGMLWYNVQWNTTSGTFTGWVDANTVTFTATASAFVQASFDVLSPDLKAYLDDIGPSVGVVLYDVTHSTYYTYNSSTQFIVASSMKVPIMLTFLDSVEQQGREPDDDEMNLLTTMIENSNNDSASTLFEAVGGASGIAGYMQKIGVAGLSPDDDSWGYSLITPQTMVDMLTMLYQGKILNEEHRVLALNFMENIEADQQAGIGDTAPLGATVAMKDGWVTGPDNLWAMNSSGIVTTSKETYIISVYTQEQSSLDDGQAIARHICGTVASLLTPQ